MSRIVQIGYDNEEQIRKKVSNVHCLYKTGELDDGQPCVILSTFNPNAKTGNVNQVLHITADVAKKLIEIFNKELLDK